MDFSHCRPDIRPIPLVVGGVVEPAHLVGRTREERAIQAGLTTADGALIVGDRRMGKTPLLRKLVKSWREVGHTVLEVRGDTENPATFAARMYNQLETVTWFKREFERWSMDVRFEASGFVLRRSGGKREVAEPVDLLSWAASQIAPKEFYVVVDELAVVLLAMQRQDPLAGSEVLNSFRSAAQAHSNLKLVLAGSIGLHHVVPHGGGHLNSLRPVLVGPMPPCDGLELACGLLAGLSAPEKRTAEYLRVRAEPIVEVAASVPYYIQWLIQQAELDGWDLPPKERLVEAIDDPLDPLDFRHYDQRLGLYYGTDATIARRLLDALAASSDGLTTKSIQGRLNRDGKPDAQTADRLDAVLTLLQRDNYITKDASRWWFANGVLQLAWRRRRGIEEIP